MTCKMSWIGNINLQDMRCGVWSLEKIQKSKMVIKILSISPLRSQTVIHISSLLQSASNWNNINRTNTQNCNQNQTEGNWDWFDFSQLPETFNEKIFYNLDRISRVLFSISIIFWELSREGLFGNILELMKCCHHKYCFEKGSMYTPLN